MSKPRRSCAEWFQRRGRGHEDRAADLERLAEPSAGPTRTSRSTMMNFFTLWEPDFLYYSLWNSTGAFNYRKIKDPEIDELTAAGARDGRPCGARRYLQAGAAAHLRRGPRRHPLVPQRVDRGAAIRRRPRHDRSSERQQLPVPQSLVEGLRVAAGARERRRPSRIKPALGSHVLRLQSPALDCADAVSDHDYHLRGHDHSSGRCRDHDHGHAEQSCRRWPVCGKRSALMIR